MDKGNAILQGEIEDVFRELEDVRERIDTSDRTRFMVWRDLGKALDELFEAAKRLDK